LLLEFSFSEYEPNIYIFQALHVIPIIFVLISIEISAQKFEDYQQKVEGEKFDFELVAITGGNFMMGNVETVKSSDEKPLHNIEVDDFWMGKYEISWTQYDAFVYAKNTADAFIPESELHKLGIDAITGASVPYVEMSFGMGKENFPAVNMTQYAALMYCKWLTAKTGIFYRLPTEAEWEYVCKKGKTDSDNALTQVAWYDENANNKYQNIGSKKSNVLGIYDLLGNVSEWVLDQYSITYYANSPENNPWNIPKTLYPIVVRGGSWKDRAFWLDPAQRRYLPEYMATNYIGFRCATDRLGVMNTKRRKPTSNGSSFKYKF